MISATDLRVNNYLLQSGRLCWVSKIYRDRFSVYTKEGRSRGIYCEPIPLTKKLLLENFGFENEGGEFSDTVLIDLEVNLQLRWNSKYNYMSAGYKNTIIDLHRFPIKYLHQLQNFYYTWKGKELEIKIDKNANRLPNAVPEIQY